MESERLKVNFAETILGTDNFSTKAHVSSKFPQERRNVRYIKVTMI